MVARDVEIWRKAGVIMDTWTLRVLLLHVAVVLLLRVLIDLQGTNVKIATWNPATVPN